MILRRFISNALELAAANAHDRQPDFIMKFRIPFHLYEVNIIGRIRWFAREM